MANVAAATATQIIEEIERLAPIERMTVLRHFREAEAVSRRLSPEELAALAEKMIEAGNTAEGDRLEQQLIAGFYGR